MLGVNDIATSLEKRANKLRHMEDYLAAFLDEHSANDVVHPERRRLRRKKSDASGTSDTDSRHVTKPTPISYEYTTSKARLFAMQKAAQRMPRRYLVHLLGATVDLDIHNTVIILCDFFVQMLGLVDRDVFADEISLLSQLAASRDNYISDTMHLDLSLQEARHTH